MADVKHVKRNDFAPDFDIPVIVVGGGGCGLTAALAARDGGMEVLVIERDPKPWGTTSMSTGLIPAAGTPEQAARGIQDSPDLFAADIQGKHGGQADPVVVQLLAEESADTVAWLRSAHRVPIDLIDGFLYPGHSAMRMYGTPNRTGAELMAGLESACTAAGVDVLTDALVTTVFAEADGTVLGVAVERPDGAIETIGCGALILACCGFAGNPDMVAQYIPEMTEAVFHGHPGNKGDAISWGHALGAAIADMDAYQGHGGLAAGHSIPILWPLIMEGGYQVNAQGKRFSDESKGYSEQAVNVLQQPGKVAWSIMDQRLYDLMIKFDDFQQAVSAGAIIKGASLADLAAATKLPADALAQTAAQVDAVKAGQAEDPFGRDFMGKPALEGPFYAARVTGALFHTQGGLEVDGQARVLRNDGTPMPNLFAGGGAARGVSGRGASGYMAGNGLLTATTLGKIAGRVAAAQLAGKSA